MVQTPQKTNLQTPCVQEASSQETRSAAGDQHKISVVMITQDEVARMGRAISSCYGFADEVVVIDGGSRDNTVQRARQLGAKVFVNPWPGYALQRQFGVQQASHDWIFLIDSDEVVGDDLAQALTVWKQSRGSGRYAFKVDRTNDFLGRWLPHHMDDQVRLFNRQHHRISNVLVHEGVDVDRSVVPKLAGTLWHYKFRSLHDQVQRFNHYTTLEAQRDYESGQRFSLVQLLLKPPARFLQQYLLRRFCTRGIAGLVNSLFWVGYDVLKAVKLYELTQQSPAHKHYG
ncbi:MAG: glycosyltransferase family 2 protein [Cyanobacteria bacterium J06632_22]